MNSMTRFLALISIILSGVSATAAPRDNTEHLDFTSDQGWKLGNSSEVRGHYLIMEFIREGDDINNWKELMTVQNFAKSSGYRSPGQTLDDLKAAREKRCPGATQWNVIDQKGNSILYEWQAKPCDGEPEQHEVARILYGKHNVFFLHYAVKVYQMPADARAEWIKKFSEAAIVSGR